MTKPNTILFGSIGALVETSDIQRRAFNQAFEEFDLGWDWDTGTYRQLLLKSGGRQRIENFAEAEGIAVDADAIHARKTEIFDAAMMSGGLTLRSGVLDTIRAAQDMGVKFGFVTSTSKANVDAMFGGLDGQITADDFGFVGNAAMVEHSKPAPDIYNAALNALDVEPREAVAVEDTAVSAQSAVAAGVRCVAFPGQYADPDTFDADMKMVGHSLDIGDLINA